MFGFYRLKSTFFRLEINTQVTIKQTLLDLSVNQQAVAETEKAEPIRFSLT
jgi:hypothetical protein